MMPIRYLVLLLGLLSSGRVIAQEMEWSNSRKLKGNAIYTYVLGQGEQGIYLLRYRNRFFTRQVILERYREQLGFADDRSFKLRHSRLVRAQLVKRSLLLFFSTYDRHSAQNVLTVRTFDEMLNESSEELTLCSSPLADYYDKGDFRVHFSHSKEEFVVSNSVYRDGQKHLMLRTFSTTDRVKRDSQQIDLGSNGQLNRVGQILFDNGTDVYFIHEWIEKNMRKGSGDITQYTLYHANPSESYTRKLQLGDTALFIQSPHISADRSRRRILVSSLYSMYNPNSFTGLVHHVYSRNEDTVPVYFTPIDEDIRKILTTDKSRRPEDELQGMEILKMIPNLDGGITLVAEMSSITSEEDIVNVNGVPQAMSRNIYNFGDLLIMSLDSLFAPRWNHVINKNQSSMNDGGYYSSAIVGHTRAHIYIIYNDQMRNNGDVIQYTVDHQGEVSSRILLRSSENYVAVIPSEASQIGYNQLLLPVNRDRRFALLKLTYPN